MSATNLLPTNGASTAPQSRWTDHRHTAHVVQFYGEDRFLLDELSRFIGNALGFGESAVIIATKEHREGLNQRLQDWGLDTARAVAQGRYLPLDAADTLSKIMHNGSPDPARFAEIVGNAIAKVKAATQGEPRRVAAFGEMVALLWADGKFEAAIRLEQLWNATELALFRVLQEALTNVHRHSGASEAGVLIQKSTGQVILEVRDNGRGIQPEMLDRFRESGQA